MEQGGAFETRQRHEMNHVDLHERIHSENRSVRHIKQNVVLPHLGSTAYSGIQRDSEYLDGSILSGNQYNSGQNHHSVSLNFTGAASSNLLETSMFPASSSSTNLSLPWNSGPANYVLSSNNQAMDYLMNGYSGTSHFTENAWRHGKEKNLEHVSGYYPFFNGSARSDISLSIISQDSGTSMHPEQQGNGTPRNPGTSVRSTRNRSSSIVGATQSAYMCYPNDLLVPNLAAQSFPCAANTWVPQLGNNIAPGGCHGWGYTNPMLMLNGKHVNSGFPGMGSLGMQRYKPVIPPAYPSPLHYSHEDLLLSDSMHLHNHIGFTQTQIPAPFYQYQLNTEPRNLNPSNGIQSNPRLRSFVSTSQQVSRPNFQLLRAYEETLHRNGALFESVGSSGLQWEDEGNVTDEHGDMRLDIDSMSYEELLALEEQIGNVNTGLTEEFISKNLKTCIHAQQLVSSMSKHEPCVICQVDYEDGESLGALDCGHMYHSCCIKQWLLIKNVCPVCKSTALTNA